MQGYRERNNEPFESAVEQKRYERLRDWIEMIVGMMKKRDL